MTGRIHGGADAQGRAQWDFSSNANACGPCPLALQAVQQADAAHYPDPAYTRLRNALAQLHGVAVERLLLATSASECIQRLTAWRWREGDRLVWTPPHAYGDYAHAASAWGMGRADTPAQAQLVWMCDPSSPLGQSLPPSEVGPLWTEPTHTLVLDRAYEPLRLRGASAWSPDQLDRVWQIWSPNKALGLTGVRAAYAIAPTWADSALRALLDMGASWPLGAHGEAMLMAWTRPEVQAWTRDSRHTLGLWMNELRRLLTQHGWACAPSDTAYLCAQPPQPIDSGRWRAGGVKLRDANSFGLVGWWRLSAQPPETLAALRHMLALSRQGSEALA